MAHSTRRPECIFLPTGEARLTFPFSRLLVDALKWHIPPRYRSYDPEERSWLVWGGYERLAIELLLEVFPDASVPRGTHAQTWANSSHPDAAHYATLYLLPTAPAEVVDAVFRVLARHHHPDRGGDVITMQRINGAYAALRERASA